MAIVRVVAFTSILLIAVSVSSAAQPPGPGAAQAVQPAMPAVPSLVAPWEPADQGTYAHYDGPREAVHRNAEWKAAQRRQRMEAMKWMGYSPLRPATSPLPFMGAQSGWIGAGIYYPLPGAIYQPALPAFVLGRSVEAASR